MNIPDGEILDSSLIPKAIITLSQARFISNCLFYSEFSAGSMISSTTINIVMCHTSFKMHEFRKSVAVTNYYFIALMEYEKVITRTLVAGIKYLNIAICVFTGKVFSMRFDMINHFDGYVDIKKIKIYHMPEILDFNSLIKLNVKTSARETLQIQRQKSGQGQYTVCIHSGRLHVHSPERQ